MLLPGTLFLLVYLSHQYIGKNEPFHKKLKNSWFAVTNDFTQQMRGAFLFNIMHAIASGHSWWDNLLKRIHFFVWGANYMQSWDPGTGLKHCFKPPAHQLNLCFHKIATHHLEEAISQLIQYLRPQLSRAAKRERAEKSDAGKLWTPRFVTPVLNYIWNQYPCSGDEPMQNYLNILPPH